MHQETDCGRCGSRDTTPAGPPPFRVCLRCGHRSVAPTPCADAADRAAYLGVAERERLVRQLTRERDEARRDRDYWRRRFLATLAT